MPSIIQFISFMLAPTMVLLLGQGAVMAQKADLPFDLLTSKCFLTLGGNDRVAIQKAGPSSIATKLRKLGINHVFVLNSDRNGALSPETLDSLRTHYSGPEIQYWVAVDFHEGTQGTSRFHYNSVAGAGQSDHGWTTSGGAKSACIVSISPHDSFGPPSSEANTFAVDQVTWEKTYAKLIKALQKAFPSRTFEPWPAP